MKLKILKNNENGKKIKNKTRNQIHFYSSNLFPLIGPTKK